MKRAAPGSPGPRWVFPAACGAAVALLVLAYSNHFDNGFHFDDSHVIENNLAIRSLHDVGRFFTDPLTFTSHPQNAVYRPLLTLSYALDYRAGGGLVPRAFHRTQFALLLALGALLFAFYRRVYDGASAGASGRWVALAAATWFCIHTANTETVNYLSSRSSLAATLGVVGSFVVYQGWPGGRRTGLYLLPMLIGGLAKPIAVMFAPLLLAYLVLCEEGSSIDGILRRWHLLARVSLRALPAFVVAGALYLFLRAMESSSLDYSDVGPLTYARSQPFVWLHYFRLFFWPRGLTADTDWRFLESWLDPRFLVGTAFVVALCAATVFLSRHASTRPVAFGLAWFSIALCPSSSFVPLSEVYNEHHIFFPYVGLALAVPWAVALVLRRLPARRAVLLGGAVALATLCAHAAGTHWRNTVWRDEGTLWRDVTEKSPGNARGLMNYGLTHMREGRLERAREYFERAALLAPNYSVLEVNLGVVTSALGDPVTAERHFLRALALAPDYASGHVFYATWLVKQGRAPEAIPHLERAIALSPSDVEAHRELLAILAAMGDTSALAAQARRVLEVDPNDAFAEALVSGHLPYPVASETAEAIAAAGLERIHRREWLEAAVLYRRALELDERSGAAWNNLGWALASAGFNELAIACFERALDVDPGQTHARSNLDWARARRDAQGASPP